MARQMLAALAAVMLFYTPAAAQQVWVTEGDFKVLYDKQPDGTLKPLNKRERVVPNIAPPEKGVSYLMNIMNRESFPRPTGPVRGFDIMERTWCYINHPHPVYESRNCTPEFHIPILSLRMFRQQAGMEINAPRYNYITSKMEPLPED